MKKIILVIFCCNLINRFSYINFLSLPIGNYIIVLYLLYHNENFKIFLLDLSYLPHIHILYHLPTVSKYLYYIIRLNLILYYNSYKVTPGLRVNCLAYALRTPGVKLFVCF